MRKRNFGVLVMCLGLALILAVAVGAGCAGEPTPTPTPTPTGPRHGGTLIFGMEAEVGYLDPAIDNSTATHRITMRMFEGLIGRDLTTPNEGRPHPIVPVLAKSWDISEDGLVWTFYLREGVKFHDGTPFNAEAVEFNVRRIWDEDSSYFFERAASLKDSSYGNLEDIQVVDDLTVKFIFNEFSAFTKTTWAEPSGIGLPLFVSPAAVKKWGNEDLLNHPVGTGPFRFVERVPGEKCVLERNPDYWDQPYPYLDRLIFVPMSEAATRVNALLIGEVNMISVVPPDRAQSIRDAGFEIAIDIMPHIWYFIPNLLEKPMQDVRVRQALNYAMDREGMAQELLGGTVRPAISIVPPTAAGFDPTWEESYPYNPTKAKELLAAAGYPDGFEMVMQTSTAGSGQLLPVEMGQWIQRDLAAVGIDAKLETFEWNTYVGMWVQGMPPGVGMMQISWGINALYWLTVPLASNTWGNAGYIEDPEIDALLEKLEKTMDEDEQVAIVREIHQLERERAYLLPIINDLGPYAMTPNVKGFIRAADWMEEYKQVWIAE